MVDFHSIYITINIKCLYYFLSPNNLYIRSTLLFVLRPHLSLSLLFRFPRLVGRNEASYRSPVPAYRNLADVLYSLAFVLSARYGKSTAKSTKENRVFRSAFFVFGGHWLPKRKRKERQSKPFFIFRKYTGFIMNNTGKNYKNKKGF